MPVIGHAIVGLAVGIATKPDKDTRPSEGGAAIWVPVILAISYLPDIVAQVMNFTGWQNARFMSHSLLFAFLGSFALAPALSRLGRFSFMRGFGISLFLILSHIVFDILQWTDRTPFWPFYEKPFTFGAGLLPSGFFAETAIFGSLFLAFIIVRKPKWSKLWADNWNAAPNWPVICGYMLSLTIIVAAIATHYMRDVNARWLYKAHTLIVERNYDGVMEAIKQAERWPSSAKPGRLDYLRAEAYLLAGDRKQAEKYYLISYEADPDYFWLLADFALFYARSDLPKDERKRKLEPYLERLRKDFRNHEAFQRNIKKIEDSLGGK